MAVDNRTLGRFHLDGIPPSPRGVPQIEVTFDIDANGILNVAAKDLGTGKSQDIKITHSSGLTETEIEKMKKDAKEHEADDKMKKEAIDLKNQADSMIFQGEKQLKEFEDKLDQDARAKIQAAIDRLKEASKTDNATELKSAIEQYNTVWNEASSKMYSQAKDQPGAGANPGAGAGQDTTGAGEPKKDDNVENADFEVVDEKK
jgi:molecular chaperone DnaK